MDLDTKRALIATELEENIKFVADARAIAGQLRASGVTELERLGEAARTCLPDSYRLDLSPLEEALLEAYAALFPVSTQFDPGGMRNAARHVTADVHPMLHTMAGQDLANAVARILELQADSLAGHLAAIVN